MNERAVSASWQASCLSLPSSLAVSMTLSLWNWWAPWLAHPMLSASKIAEKI